MLGMCLHACDSACVYMCLCVCMCWLDNVVAWEPALCFEVDALIPRDKADDIGDD